MSAPLAPALAAVLALSLTACGGDDPEAVPQGGDPATTSAAASPTPSPSETAEPLSAFEEEPQVKVARRLFAAVAKDINAGDRSMPASAPFLNKLGKQKFPVLAAEDFGLRYPGPLPFTPVALRPDGSIVACMMLDGWAVDPDTGKAARPRNVAPVRILMARQAGRWKVANLLDSTVDCSDVTVRGVKS